VSEEKPNLWRVFTLLLERGETCKEIEEKILAEEFLAP